MIWFSRKWLFVLNAERNGRDRHSIATETRKHKSLFNVRMKISGRVGMAQSDRLKQRQGQTYKARSI